ncbi:ATP-dependent DNA helicase [Heracleum sosnowskyi]|uniref:ATP-dependent DNA helicase n=1 Tax=Heracleum sosnowskyi TaxID=360622 RepID=A0AAD8H8B5_9APIA|nr:ATP-dependent DNA helicase [Heracleum sosnowskyi]
MLLRNIDQQSGLCNGTRLQVCQLGNHVIEAKILSGNNMGQKVSIPRILMCPSDVRSVFSHRQLNVAIPRVTHKAGFKILICHHKGHTRNTTTNVVYKEVFRNI